MIYFSRFLPTWDLGGGSRRTMQISEILHGLGCELWSSARGDGRAAGSAQDSDEPAESRRDGGGNGALWSDARRPFVLRQREICREWSRALRARPDPGLVVMDDPIYFSPLLEELSARATPVVGICHNLESMVPGQPTAGAAQELLIEELQALARCRLVVTISREETWLLTNLGIRCLYYPYYPQEPVLGRLRAVRQRRLGSSGERREGIVLLGSAANPPTVLGMTAAIDAWRRLGLARRHGPLLVAGHWTEKNLPATLFDHDVRLLGTLDDAALGDLLGRVAACLCHQEAGSGVLTRICEMRIAHVPVVASAHAARSYRGLEGVVEIDRLESLPDALAGLEALASIPMPPPPDPASLRAACGSIPAPTRAALAPSCVASSER